MNQEFEARYFDGQSSASQKSTLVWYEPLKILRLHLVDGGFLDWHPSDILINSIGNLLELRNKKFPGALLVLEGNEASHALHQALKQNQGFDIYGRLINLGFSKTVGLAIFLLGLLVLAYFFLLPPLAEKAVILLPESIDNELGDMVSDNWIEESEVNEEKTEYLNEFASLFQWNNTKPLHFTVINSPDVNAFALPNGEILVYSGILKQLESPAELAALLSHEASHINQRHSVKMLSRNIAGYAIISLLLSDANGVMTILVENAQQLHSLSYSRKFEREADEQGLQLLRDNQVDPYGMVRLFEQLKEEHETELPSLISTHPLTEDRKKHMEELINASPYSLAPSPQMDSLFARIKEKL